MGAADDLCRVNSKKSLEEYIIDEKLRAVHNRSIEEKYPLAVRPNKNNASYPATA